MKPEQLACVSEDLNANAFSSIKVVYACNAREILVSGPLLMCAWRFETSGLRRVGFPSEVSVSGMLKARFREDEGSTKLHRIELAFDCMAVMQQLNAHGLLDVAAIAQAAATPVASWRGGNAGDNAWGRVRICFFGPNPLPDPPRNS